MDYNNELKNLRNNKNLVVDEIKYLDKSKTKELKELKKLVEQKYSELKQVSFNDLNTKPREVDNYCKLIEKNSTMGSEIFDVITELISIFEGEHYILERLNYHKYNSSPASVWETYMIMPKNVFDNITNPKYIRERYFHHLKKHGIALIIVEDWSLYYLPNDFTFYKTENMGRLIPQISFKGFPYIKEFIDYIINYRIENKIDDLTEEDMRKLKEEFILLNVDNILNNYQLKKEKKMQQINKNINSEYEHSEKVLKRLVKKINSIL